MFRSRDESQGCRVPEEPGAYESLASPFAYSVRKTRDDTTFDFIHVFGELLVTVLVRLGEKPGELSGHLCFGNSSVLLAIQFGGRFPDKAPRADRGMPSFDPDSSNRSSSCRSSILQCTGGVRQIFFRYFLVTLGVKIRQDRAGIATASTLPGFVTGLTWIRLLHACLESQSRE